MKKKMKKQKKWQNERENVETIETLHTHTHTHTHLHLKNEKGITLIALAVTIVVLIILALIGINAVFGEHGLIATTQYSKEEHRAGSVRDEVIEWRNGKNLSKEMGEVVKLRAELLDELIAKELLTQEERETVEEYDEVKIASQTIVIEPDDQESLNANLTIEKKILYKNGEAYKSGDVFKLGDTVTYEIMVKNIGNQTVGNIVVEDILTIKGPNRNEEIKQEFSELEDMNGNKIGNTLEANQEGYIRYTYTIIQEDLGAELSNKAQVKGKNKIPIGEKPVETPVAEPTCTLTIQKSFEGTYNDEKAEMTITLKNTAGNILTEEYDYYMGADSSQTKKVKSGDKIYLGNLEAITIIGLPDGVQYEIEETEAPFRYKVSETKKGNININNNNGSKFVDIVNKVRMITWEFYPEDQPKNGMTIKMYKLADIFNIEYEPNIIGTEKMLNYVHDAFIGIENIQSLPITDGYEIYRINNMDVVFNNMDRVEPDVTLTTGENGIARVELEVGAEYLIMLENSREYEGSAYAPDESYVYYVFKGNESMIEDTPEEMPLFSEGPGMSVYSDVQYDEEKEIYQVPDMVRVPYVALTARRVMVIWDDEGYEDLRPSRNTAVLDYRLLDVRATNNWRGDFGVVGRVNEEFSFAFDRPTPEHVIKSIELQGITYVVTIICVPLPDPGIPDEPDVPITDVPDVDVPL